uniref:Protein FAR1-RELATED SEQUENCE n=1 Tax=Fagus sylvatica TaxID=28930 RepID=A0A2N9FFN3_FAGSY
MSTSEMDGVRSFAASASIVEDLPQPVEGNMQDTLESVLRNLVSESTVGMEFGSLVEVTEFYRKYAYSKGFATITRNSRRNKGFTETSYINLKCNQEGTYNSLVDDASKKRRISTDTKRRLLIIDNADVRVNSSIKSSIVEGGGYENVTYNEKDVRNFLDKERRLKCKEGDGQVLHDYFVRMQGKNSNFYHALDLDDELHVQNVFWVDVRSKKLSGLEVYHDIKYYLLKAVHHSMIVEEFEELWNHTITSHHLQENEWLANLYEERERWVSMFLKGNFFAGMSSTQHSESMNTFFDGYLHSSTTLKVFVEKFENALRNKVEKEIKSDFECFKGKLECSPSSPMEKQCLSLEAYYVGMPYLCFPRKVSLYSRRGAESVENFNVLEKLLIDLKDNFPRSCDKYPLPQRKNSVGVSVDVPRTEVVRSPKVVNRKGRPRMKRLKSSMEKAVSKPKKKRNTVTARNVAQSASVTKVGGSAFGDDSTLNMSISGSQAHRYEGEASNLI